MKILILVSALTLIYLSSAGLTRGQGIQSTTISLNQFSDQSTLSDQSASQSGGTVFASKNGPVSKLAAPVMNFTPILEAIKALPPTKQAYMNAQLQSIGADSAPEMEKNGVPDKPIVKEKLLGIGSELGVTAGLSPDKYIYSGFQNGPLPFIVSSDWYTRETFNEKNSFLGTGVVNTFGTDTGVDIGTRTGFSFNPDFGYKYGARDLNAANAMYSDGYVGQLNFAQKIFPLVAMTRDQPGATYNLRDATTDDLDRASFDIFPNFSVVMGLTLQFTALSSTTLTKGTRLKGTQNSWDIAPNLTFQFNVTDSYTIQVQPSWDETLSSNDVGQSASGGTIQIQLRNQYTKALDSVTLSPGKPALVREAFIVTQYEALLHDTNQEPLPTSTAPHVTYQNWAAFGVSGVYKKMYNDDAKHPEYLQFRVDYSYQAFNAAFEGHTLVASLNVDF
jgi:hypothetical protein